MNHMKISLALRSTRLPCAALFLVLAGGTCAAAASAPAPAAAASQQPAQEIAELDEIWIHGKRLADRITDAEDEFFPIYNKVNKNDDYDIKCGYTYLSPDSMIMSRLCAPGFLGKDYGAPPSRWVTCYGFFPYAYGPYAYGRYAMSGPCYDSGGYEPPSPAFIVMAKSEDLRKNMTQVINSDPRLRAMAAHLGDLYLELNAVQHSYRKTKGIERDATRVNRKAVKTNAGPRT
jgi:hypothetical protein